jgi:site-specific DNA-methyltransferase (adenine-specific)
MKLPIKSGELWHGDCLQMMRDIPSGSVDMILCDLPYGTTQNKWDTVIPFEPLWAEYWRIAKPNAVVVLTAQCPFDKVLGCSQIAYLKYEWIWQKEMGTGHLNAKKQPLKNAENALVFYRDQCIYNPQMLTGKPYKITKGGESSNYRPSGTVVTESDGERYPLNIINFPRDKSKIHPTQKPVALFEYLIKTYTNPGALVLDNCIGSGTTAVAAEATGRRWIGIEQNLEYFLKAWLRVSA